MPIVFEDNSLKLKTQLTDGLSAFMEEVGQEIQSQTVRNSKKRTGNTAGSYDHIVRESFLAGEIEVQVGSDMENAIWEEYGTGEYALHGDGRKGGWVYQDVKGDFHHTYGKQPRQPLTKAFKSVAPKVQRTLESMIRKSLGD